jgi:diadenosine tetraphosphatase ApaH/serine/threonine PP2A family protein phosphatase
MNDSRVHHIIKSIISAAAACKQVDQSIVKQDDFMQIINDAKEVIKNEPLVIELSGDMCVVGDIHGSIHSLVSILSKVGYPPEQKYVFLGDYVDRGKSGVEVIMLLYSLKILYPDSVYLLRGNHESGHLTRMYGFRHETMKKYSNAIYSAVIDSFSHLPVMAKHNKILLLHGGIPENGFSLDIIKMMQKPKDIMDPGVFSDILWSDPNPSIDSFAESGRGIGHIFGKNVLIKFLKSNDLSMLIRSHQVCQDGFEYPFNDGSSHSTVCLTVFSCHDYMNKGNDAAVAVIKDNTNPSLQVITVSLQTFVFPQFIKEEVLDHPMIETALLPVEIFNCVA